MANKNERFVVYDCDIGTDDAWGLLMLLKAEALAVSRKTSNDAMRHIKLVAITCVHGNTDVNYGSQNALRLLELTGRTDIPIYQGCDEPLVERTWQRQSYYHGKDGFGELEHTDQLDLTKIQKKHAVDIMYELACKYPQQVDYLLVGPLTNFAECINKFGTEFLSKVGDIYIMGGNYRGKGNITKSAEFNFYMDPEAANVILRAVKKPLTILPWESCIDSNLGLTLKWRLEELAKGDNPALDLLNRAEQKLCVAKGHVHWVVCDAMLVAAYLFPKVIQLTRTYHATVELTGTHTRGQMVLDHLRREEDNTNIVFAFHKDVYKNIISWTAGIEDIEL